MHQRVETGGEVVATAADALISMHDDRVQVASGVETQKMPERSARISRGGRRALKKPTIAMSAEADVVGCTVGTARAGLV
jgi:hypothetical protein